QPRPADVDILVRPGGRVERIRHRRGRAGMVLARHRHRGRVCGSYRHHRSCRETAERAACGFDSHELMDRQSFELASNSHAQLTAMTRFALAPGPVLGVEYCGAQLHNSRPDPHERILPMSYLVDGYHRDTVATAPVSARVAFIRRTYAHLAAAILA